MANIRWREQDVDLLRREIRNYNRKIDRLMKTGAPEVKAALPPKMSLKTARSQIKTRSEFNATIKSIKRLTARGSEQLIKTRGGVTAPKFEIKEIEARVRSINARRKQQLSRLGTIEPGNIPMMGRIREANLQPKKPVGKIRPEDWEEYKRSVLKQSDKLYSQRMAAQYKANYLKGLEELFSTEEITDIRKKIDKYTDEEFVEMSLSDDVLYVQFYSDPLARETKRSLIIDKIKNL